MLRVCGITYTHTSNFGSCLQAYALQHVVENMQIGGEHCQYNLIPIGIYSWSDVKKKRTLIQKVRGKILGKAFSHFKKPFSAFNKQFMHYSPCPSRSALPSLNQTTDAFVCGSDVIWNPKYNQGLEAFYLNFTTKYSFSYAASFGSSQLSDEYFQKYGKWIDKLDAISVRESQGVENAARCTKKPVAVTVDPVLLMTREEWDQVAEKENRDGKYILVYSIGNKPILDEFVKKLKKQTGLKTILTIGNVKESFRRHVYSTKTPQRWLQLIRDAEYVVTNSFHGTAFSVIFHKTFFTTVIGEINEGFNVRQYNLLSKAGLLDQLFNRVPDTIQLAAPDYSQVDARLEELKASSLTFLRDNLEAALQRKRESEAAARA